MRTTLWIALLVVNAGAQPPDIEGAYWGDAVSEIALVRAQAMDDGLIGHVGDRQFRRWVDRWTSDLPGGWDL